MSTVVTQVATDYKVADISLAEQCAYALGNRRVREEASGTVRGVVRGSVGSAPSRRRESGIVDTVSSQMLR